MSDPTYKKIGEYSGLAEVTDSTLLLASLGGNTYSLEAETVKDYIMESLDIDATPTQGSGNPVSSGGTYTAIAAVDAKTVTDTNLNTTGKPADAKAAGDAVAKAYGTAILGGSIGLLERDAEYHWAQGSVSGSTGAAVTSDQFHIRTLATASYGYPYLDATSRITCDADHKFYVTIGSSTTDHAGVINPLTGVVELVEVADYHYTQDLFFGNLTGKFGSRHDQYRITIARVDGGKIVTGDISSVTIHTYRATDETLTMANIPADAKETGRRIGVTDIDLSTGTLISGKAIRDNNTIISSNQMATTEITRDSSWSAIAVEANDQRATLVTFLTGSIAELSGGDSISGLLATGETGRRTIGPGESNRFVLPEDCTVIAVTTKSSNNDHTPSYIAGISDHSAAWYAEYVVGKLPAKDIPAPPSADGTYTLRATVSSGTVTYSWVAG